MTDSAAGFTTNPDGHLYAQIASAGKDATVAQAPDASVSSPLHDELHGYVQTKFGPGQSSDTTSDTVLVASSDTASSAVGSVLNYAGYITYAGLIASAFGHDDPFNLQTRATRFFQEKILHHHAIDNPQVWAAMGDALMTEQHLASQGAHFKPLKLSTMKGEIKRESANGGLQDAGKEHDAKDANDIIKDITSGLKSPDDYVLAAKFLYSESVQKADARAVKEGQDHKDEKRLLGRLNLLSGETDRTDAIGAMDNSVSPMLDELGSRVSFRLDEAAFLDRYGSHVPELGWKKEADDLRAQAKAIYEDPNALSEPVRRRLHQKYSDVLTDKPAQGPVVPG